MAARGKHSVQEAFKKTLKIPTIYSAILAVIANYFYNSIFINLDKESLIFRVLDPLINSVVNVCDKFVGAYVVLGMLMIGLGLAKVKKVKFDWKFLSITFFAKFIVFPLMAFTFGILNNNYLHFYSKEVIALIFLMSLVPIGANTITLATQLKLNTDNVSIAVFSSTFFALIYIPTIWLFVGALLR